jgi:hypothetical protein
VLLGSGAGLLVGASAIELWRYRHKDRHQRVSLTPGLTAFAVRGTF